MITNENNHMSYLFCMDTIKKTIQGLRLHKKQIIRSQGVGFKFHKSCVALNTARLEDLLRLRREILWGNTRE